jgi:hypothetical protein
MTVRKRSIALLAIDAARCNIHREHFPGVGIKPLVGQTVLLSMAQGITIALEPMEAPELDKPFTGIPLRSLDEKVSQALPERERQRVYADTFEKLVDVMGCRVGEENATLDKSMNKQRETISRKAGLIKIAIEMHLES